MMDDCCFGGGGLGGRNKTYDWADDIVPKKKKKPKMIYKVYLTKLEDGRFYIGYTGKEGKALDRYFGSSKTIKEYKGKKEKVILDKYEKISHAQYREMLLQIKYLKDPMCINGTIRCQLLIKGLQDFEEDSDGSI